MLSNQGQSVGPRRGKRPRLGGFDNASGIQIVLSDFGGKPMKVMPIAFAVMLIGASHAQSACAPRQPAAAPASCVNIDGLWQTQVYEMYLHITQTGCRIRAYTSYDSLKGAIEVHWNKSHIRRIVSKKESETLVGRWDARSSTFDYDLTRTEQQPPHCETHFHGHLGNFSPDGNGPDRMTADVDGTLGKCGFPRHWTESSTWLSVPRPKYRARLAP